MANEIKFQSSPANPLVMVPTYVNGQGPFDFVLDTGASVTVLSTELAKSLGIQNGETKEGMGAGGKVEVTMSKVESLAVGTYEQKDMQVAVVDFASLGKYCEGGLKGVVGYNFLKKYSVTVDYLGRVLRLE